VSLTCNLGANKKTFQGDPGTALDRLEADARAAADGATGGKKHKKKKTKEATAGSVLKKPSAGGVLKKPSARKVNALKSIGRFTPLPSRSTSRRKLAWRRRTTLHALLVPRSSRSDEA